MRQLRVAPHRRHVHRGHRRHELLDTDIDIGQGLAGGILHGHLKGAFARGWRIWLRAKRDVHTRAPRRRGCRGGRSLVVLKASAELALGIEEEGRAGGHLLAVLEAFKDLSAVGEMSSCLDGARCEYSVTRRDEHHLPSTGVEYGICGDGQRRPTAAAELHVRIHARLQTATIIRQLKSDLDRAALLLDERVDVDRATRKRLTWIGIECDRRTLADTDVP